MAYKFLRMVLAKNKYPVKSFLTRVCKIVGTQKSIHKSLFYFLINSTVQLLTNRSINNLKNLLGTYLESYLISLKELHHRCLKGF